LFVIFQLLVKGSNNPYKNYLAIVLILVIFISNTGGHIINSGTAGFLLAILLALTKYKNIMRRNQ